MTTCRQSSARSARMPSADVQTVAKDTAFGIPHDAVCVQTRWFAIRHAARSESGALLVNLTPGTERRRRYSFQLRRFTNDYLVFDAS